MIVSSLDLHLFEPGKTSVSLIRPDRFHEQLSVNQNAVKQGNRLSVRLEFYESSLNMPLLATIWVLKRASTLTGRHLGACRHSLPMYPVRELFLDQLASEITNTAG